MRVTVIGSVCLSGENMLLRSCLQYTYMTKMLGSKVMTINTDPRSSLWRQKVPADSFRMDRQI